MAGTSTNGTRVGDYLQQLRAAKGWSREHTAAMIRARTGGHGDRPW